MRRREQPSARDKRRGSPGRRDERSPRGSVSFAHAWEALGLFAGPAEYIPLFGPFIAAGPALIVAFGDGPLRALEVTAMILGVRLVEANLLQPWLQRRLAALPPVASVFGLLFGPLGVILAAPPAIASLTLVRVFYLETEIPGSA